MLINEANIAGLFRGFNTSFNKGFTAAPSFWRDLAMRVPSTTSETNYAWLGAMPGIREWIGDRHVNNLSVSDYTVVNRDFELTIKIGRNKIEDDQYGVFGPMFEKMGADTKRHPDELVFGLLAQGFTSPCYDKQYFFDTDHPVGGIGDVALSSASNVQAGAGTPWYLIDAGQPLKPLIYQERRPFEFQRFDKPSDDNVFWKNEYVYGTSGRSNVGFGLWQLAYASKAELSAANYESARAAMMGQKGDNGKTLGITPTHLVVPPSLEGPARRVLKALNADGGTNEWADSAKLIVSHYLAA